MTGTRTARTLAVLLAVGGVVFGYGLAVTVDLLPSGWGPLGVLQYVLLQLGALWVALALLVLGASVYRGTRGGPTRTATLVALGATAVAVLVTVAAYRLGGGSRATPQFLEWTTLGLLVTSLQFPLGTVEPRRRRRAAFLAELVVITGGLFVFLAVDRGTVQAGSFLFVGGGASLLLVLFGWPFFRLGERFLEEPRGWVAVSIRR